MLSGLVALLPALPVPATSVASAATRDVQVVSPIASQGSRDGARLVTVRQVSQRAGRATPVSVRIPAIGVATRLVPLHVSARTHVLQPPGGPDVVGWFRAGPVPGAIGPAVLAGHRDSVDGPAVFYRLGELRRGDTVSVQRSDHQVVWFRVSEVAQYAKAEFPTEAVYGPTSQRALRLITCGGSYDFAAGAYVDNVVVFAHRVPVPR